MPDCLEGSRKLLEAVWSLGWRGRGIVLGLVSEGWILAVLLLFVDFSDFGADWMCSCGVIWDKG